MQNAGLAALGLNWRYLAFEVPPDNLRAAVQGAKAMNFIGLNLTVPHKLLAVGMVDVLDESARSWGAVNTIVFEGRDERGAWHPVGEFTEVPRETRSHGFNTDADAITRALREDLGLELTRCEGPAARRGRSRADRRAQAGLRGRRRSFSWSIGLAARRKSAASEIRERCPGVKVAVGYPAGAVDLVLNATSLGLNPNDPVPFDEQQFSLRQVGRGV